LQKSPKPGGSQSVKLKEPQANLKKTL